MQGLFSWQFQTAKGSDCIIPSYSSFDTKQETKPTLYSLDVAQALYNYRKYSVLVDLDPWVNTWLPWKVNLEYVRYFFVCDKLTVKRA